MAKKTLTAAAIQRLLPSERRREVPDAGCPGLRLIIQPSGSKSWALRFRRPDGRTGKLTLGRFDPLDEMSGEPVLGGPLTLMAARRLATEIMRQRALGKDVIADAMAERRRRRSDRVDKAERGFAAMARKFVVEHARAKTRSWKGTARVLGLNATTLEPTPGGLAARWRDKMVSEITPDDIHDLATEIRNEGVPGLKARKGLSDMRARASVVRMSKFFAWSVQHRLTASNPTSGVWRPSPAPPRERVLSDAELRIFWRAAGELGHPCGPLLKVLALTGQRVGEVSGMKWDELSEDRSTWTLPASRVKNKRQHLVPLSRMARGIIAGVRVEGPYVFTRNGRVPVTIGSVVKGRLDARMQALARAESLAIAPWVVHDLRRSVATNLQKLGVRLEITEKILNHQSGSFRGIVSVYQKHEYLDERRDALTAWAAHVERITSSP